MASPRLLVKLIGAVGSISSGVLAACCRRGEGESASPVPPPPDIALELLELVAETSAAAAHPDEAALGKARVALAALVERYGTVRAAVEALDSGGRRHDALSHDRAGAWASLMDATVAQIDSTVKRFPALNLHLGRWIALQGERLDGRLDALAAWRATPIDESPWLQALGSANTRPSPAAASTQEGGAALDARAFHARILGCKPLVNAAAPGKGPAMTPGERADAERLAASTDGFSRAIGLIALAKFAAAEALLPELRATLHPADFWALQGDRFFFEGHFDEAIDCYKHARSARDDASARINLASALVRSKRMPVEPLTKEAVDILSDCLRSLPANHPQRRRVQACLAAAWMGHHGGERDTNLRMALEHLESAVDGLEPAADASLWAETHMELGSAWASLPSGNKLENLQRAITCFERCLQIWSRDVWLEHWAMVHNALGHAWDSLPSGDRAGNIRRAIACYQAALDVRTRATNPVGWAMLQNNLGNALVQMPGGAEGDFASNVRKAIEHHLSALEVWSDQDRRIEWAATQNNLGNAWALLPADGEEREKNLRRAIAAYKAALEVRTRAGYPAEWASTQNNLGSALMHLPPKAGDETAIREAIACFERALEVRTREAYPVDWAKTQANLGNAWLRLPVRGSARGAYLEKARDCYAHSLVIFTRAAHPHQHDHVAQKKAEVMDLIDELQLLG